jgi:hypothetical protein
MHPLSPARLPTLRRVSALAAMIGSAARENHADDYRHQPQRDGEKRTELHEKRGCKRSHGR